MAQGLSAQVRSALLLVFLAVSVVFLTQVALAAVDEDDVRRDLPIALDGEVWAVEQIGNSIVVGGNFTRVQISRDGPIVNQAAIYAYDIDSGEFDPDFRPIILRTNGNAEVRDILPAGDGTGLYIGGRFTAIDDRSDGRVRVRNRLALLDVRSGRLDRNFAQAGVDAAVLSLDRDNQGRIYVGGNFLTVFDLAPGRPPIEQQVRGLARFNGDTGQFDTGFRYESRVDIGRSVDTRGAPRTFGVSRLQFNPSRTRLFIAHRGAEFYDVVRDTVHDSPGLARMIISPTQHFATEFKALHPDPNDPIQEFYNGRQCGRGMQVRDMDVQNGFLVVVHQGADAGHQCDTAVRFSTDGGEKRPDWVARVFDSVFSVEVDGNDVYIGGHFRYLVNSSAPSPYPGRTRANGAGAGDIYTADPARDPQFRAELVEPGYVFPVGQLGRLDARTGFGDPTFDPGSNAQVGVLELTAVDRGLLLGQDRDRVNDVLTGRSAFFDVDPNAFNPLCSVSLNEAGIPVISWTNIGDVRNWNVAVNGTFLATQPGTTTQFVHNAATPGETASYELRYNRLGTARTNDCGSITLPVPSLSCTATLSAVDGQVTVRWNDEGWSRVTIRANDAFVANVETQAEVYTETGSPGSTAYAVRAFINGEQIQEDCGQPIVIQAPGLVCTATVTGNQVTLNWNDAGWDRSSVRRNGAFHINVEDALTFTEIAPIGTTVYSIRAVINGEQANTDCTPTVVVAPPAAPVLTCTESVNGAGNLVLGWNDVGASSYQVRTNDAWTATLDEGTTQYVTENNGDTLTIRYRLDGERFDVTCG